jgi:hypothetical protein
MPLRRHGIVKASTVVSGTIPARASLAGMTVSEASASAQKVRFSARRARLLALGDLQNKLPILAEHNLPPLLNKNRLFSAKVKLNATYEQEGWFVGGWQRRKHRPTDRVMLRLAAILSYFTWLTHSRSPVARFFCWRDALAGRHHVYGIAAPMTAALMRSTNRLPIIPADLASHDGCGFSGLAEP